eukprot:403341140
MLDRIKRKIMQSGVDHDDDQDSTPSQQNQRNKDSSHNASSVIQMAGNFIKNELYDDLVKSGAQSALNMVKNTANQAAKSASHHISQSQLSQSQIFNDMDQHILETLLTENRQLKQDLKVRSSTIEELKEQVDTLTYLESEASEDNEVMRYKVLSLEGQAAIDGTELEDLKIIDQLRIAKKELHGELEIAKTQIQAYKILLNNELLIQSDETPNEEQSNQILESSDPKIVLGQLKVLYDLNKIELGEDSQRQLAISVYLQEKETYRFYREKLYQKIALKAIQQAEYLYKIRNQSYQNEIVQEGQPPQQQQSKMFLENKRYKKDIKELKTQLEESQAQLSQQVALNSGLSSKNEKICQKLSDTRKKLDNLRADYNQLKQQVHENEELTKSYIGPNINLISQQVSQFQAQQKSKLQEAHKAVFDKNKQIADYFNANNQMKQQLQNLQSDLFNENNQLKSQVQDHEQKQLKLQSELHNLKKKVDLDIQGSKYEISELRNQNEHLEQEYKRMEKELKQTTDKLKKVSQNNDQVSLDYFSSLASGAGTINTKQQNNDKKEYEELQKKYQDLEQKSKGFEQELNKMLREKLGMQDQEKISKEVEEARKAVYEKNKTIGDMSNQIRELEDKLSKQQQNPIQQQQVSQQDNAKAEYDKMLREKLGIKQEQISKEVEEARKAVFEKNKQINDLYNKNRELEEKLSQRSQQEEIKQTYDKMLREKLGIKDEPISKEVEEARKAVYEKNKTINSMANEQMDLKKRIKELEDKLQIGSQDAGNSSNYNYQSSNFGSTKQPSQQVPKQESDFFGGFFSTIQKQIFGAEEEAKQSQSQSNKQEQQYPSQSYQPNQSQQKQESAQKQQDSQQTLSFLDSLTTLSGQESNKAQTIQKSQKNNNAIDFQGFGQINNKQSKQEVDDDEQSSFLDQFTTQSQSQTIIKKNNQKQKQGAGVMSFGMQDQTSTSPIKSQDQNPIPKQQNDSSKTNVISFGFSNQTGQQNIEKASNLDSDFNFLADTKTLNSSASKPSTTQQKQNDPLDFLNFVTTSTPSTTQNKKLVTAPIQDLDFLNDMFTGLIGQQVSKQPIQNNTENKNKTSNHEESKSVDANIQVKNEPSNTVAAGWGQEDEDILSIEEDHSLVKQQDTDDTPSVNQVQTYVQEVDKLQNTEEPAKIEINEVGWGEEEEIIIDNDIEAKQVDQVKQDAINQQQQFDDMAQQDNTQHQLEHIDIGDAWNDDKDLDIEIQEDYTQNMTEQPPINMNTSPIVQQDQQQLLNKSPIQDYIDTHQSAQKQQEIETQPQQIDAKNSVSDVVAGGWGDDDIEDLPIIEDEVLDQKQIEQSHQDQPNYVKLKQSPTKPADDQVSKQSHTHQQDEESEEIKHDEIEQQVKIDLQEPQKQQAQNDLVINDEYIQDANQQEQQHYISINPTEEINNQHNIDHSDSPVEVLTDEYDQNDSINQHNQINHNDSNQHQKEDEEQIDTTTTGAVKDSNNLPAVDYNQLQFQQDQQQYDQEYLDYQDYDDEEEDNNNQEGFQHLITDEERQNLIDISNQQVNHQFAQFMGDYDDEDANEQDDQVDEEDSNQQQQLQQDDDEERKVDILQEDQSQKEEQVFNQEKDQISPAHHQIHNKLIDNQTIEMQQQNPLSNTQDDEERLSYEQKDNQEEIKEQSQQVIEDEPVQTTKPQEILNFGVEMNQNDTHDDFQMDFEADPVQEEELKVDLIIDAPSKIEEHSSNAQAQHIDLDNQGWGDDDEIKLEGDDNIDDQLQIEEDSWGQEDQLQTTKKQVEAKQETKKTADTFDPFALLNQMTKNTQKQQPPSLDILDQFLTPEVTNNKFQQKSVGSSNQLDILNDFLNMGASNNANTSKNTKQVEDDVKNNISPKQREEIKQEQKDRGWSADMDDIIVDADEQLESNLQEDDINQQVDALVNVQQNLLGNQATEVGGWDDNDILDI